MLSFFFLEHDNCHLIHINSQSMDIPYPFPYYMIKTNPRGLEESEGE